MTYKETVAAISRREIATTPALPGAKPSAHLGVALGLALGLTGCALFLQRSGPRPMSATTRRITQGRY